MYLETYCVTRAHLDQHTPTYPHVPPTQVCFEEMVGEAVILIHGETGHQATVSIPSWTPTNDQTTRV